MPTLCFTTHMRVFSLWPMPFLMLSSYQPSTLACSRLEDDVLLVDEASRVLSEASPPPRAAPRERTPEAPGRLTTGQLRGVVRAFRKAAPAGYVKLNEAADVLARLGARGGLAAAWSGAGVNALLHALRLYDPVHSTYLDWRELAVHLVQASFPLVAAATCADMADSVEVSWERLRCVHHEQGSYCCAG